MENLPTEIIENILSSLPIEPTLQSKRVCTTWRNLIGDNKTGLLFAYMDLNNLPAESKPEVQLYYGDQYEVNSEQYYSKKTLTRLDRVNYSLPNKDGNCYVHMVGSCNGLVCLHSYNKLTNARCGGICNPVTGEFVFLPGLEEPRYSKLDTIGFGYVPSTNEYKVVRCSYKDVNGVRKGCVEVYTLGSQSGWRGKEKIPYHYRFYSSGLFANGAIHWIGERGRRDRRLYNKIVAYDLVDEKFKHVSSLPFDNFKPYDGCHIKLMGGNLCAIRSIGGRDEILIWALKKRTERTLRPRLTREEEYYDQSWSWSKEFRIKISGPENYRFRPLAITKSNEVLFWHDHKKLYCYDKNTSTLTKLWEDDGKGFSCLQAIPHMNTLVSLKDLGECGGENVISSDNGESFRE